MLVREPGDEEDLAPHRRPGDPSQIDEARATELEERLLARPKLAVDHLLADEARRVAVHPRVGRLHAEEEPRRLVAGGPSRRGPQDEEHRRRRATQTLAPTRARVYIGHVQVARR